MSETGNIEQLAKIVSNDIFKWFKWKTCAPKDLDWTCESEHHKKRTHPSDVVFYYDDPYTGRTTYLNTDLKSYAKGSITKASIFGALKSLSMSVECANISHSWQEKFLLEDVDFGQVAGLLFIFNHDGQFDKDFSELMEQIEFDKLPIAEGNELAIMGPDLIERLINIVSDMKMLKADDVFPNTNDYTFYYPDLVRSRRCGDEWGKPATIESLTGPWLFLKHRGGEKFGEGFVIYYHSSGETVEEFIYLIDAMSHYQMLSSGLSIRVRFTNASENAPINLDKAKHEYLRMWGSDLARKEQMQRIDAAQVTHFVKSFNPIEIGMRQND